MQLDSCSVRLITRSSNRQPDPLCLQWTGVSFSVAASSFSAIRDLQSVWRSLQVGHWLTCRVNILFQNICKVVKRTNSLSYFFCYFSAIYNSKILRREKYKKCFPAHLWLTQTADDVTLPAAEDWTWARSLQTHRTLHPLQLLSLPLPIIISHNLQEILTIFSQKYVYFFF